VTSTKPVLRVAMIGYAFMGAAHSQVWRTAPRVFDLPLTPEMTLLVGRSQERLAAAAEQLGWASTATDWRRAVERDDVDLVDICTPGDTHAEIAIAALEAGKHVLCEKPLANSVAEAERMADAANKAHANGVRAMVGFTYRRVPAVALARRLVEQGRIGEVRHVRAQYLQDWIADPEAPLSWRLQKEKAGSGALGDIGAHAADLAQFVVGDSISDVSGRLTTFVKERPLAAGHSGLTFTASAERGPVTVDDAAAFLARFRGGAVGVFEATRFAWGRKNALRLEVNGSRGSLAFDFENMNYLEFYDAEEDPDTAGFHRILVTEPQHGFTHQVVDLVTAIAGGTDPAPSFTDGLQVQRVLAAVESSSESGRWESVPE
jgi:predicted dehydrogenase